MDYDVIILGAGPAGAAAAMTLARAGRRVLVLEQGDGQAFKVGESLPPAAGALLRKLGLAAFVEQGPHLRSHGSLSAWGGPGLMESDFLMHPEGHGWHLDRGAFDAMLCDLAAQAGATVRRGASPRGADRTQEGWTLTFEGMAEASTTSSRFIMDATGLARWLARRLGSESATYDRLIALAAVFEGASPPRNEGSRSLVEARPDGWWYTAPLPSSRRVAVYFTDGDDPAHRELFTSEGFLRRLAATQYARDHVLGGGYTLCHPPRGWPAYSSRLSRIVGEAWVAVGDAAGTYDPLSSQGLLCALRTGEESARAIDRALEGDRAALEAYAIHFAGAYAEYLRERRRYYGAERRWERRPFWQRRHASHP